MNGLVQAGQSGSRLFVLRDAETGDPITGASPSVTVRIGGSEAAGQGSVSELSDGSYLYTFAAGEIADPGSGYIRATATGAVTAIWPVEVVEYDPRASQQIDTPTNFTALAITPGGAVTADVEVDESGIADAVWSRSTRTLSSFGSLANDVRDAVWGATQRTLTAISDSAGVETLLGRLTEAWAARLDAPVSDVTSAVGDLNNLSAADVRAQADAALAGYDTATMTGISNARDEVVSHGDANWIGGGGGDSAWTVEQRNTVLADAAGARTAAEGAATPEDVNAAVAGLSTLDSAAVQAAAAAALEGYDGPNRADLTAAFEALNDLSAAEVQGLVAALLEAATVQADIRRINDVEVTGAGTAASPWGPA